MEDSLTKRLQMLKKCIVNVSIDTAGPITQDRVFLLSLEELETYTSFSICMCHRYNESGSGELVFCSSGKPDDSVTYINDGGSFLL